MHILNTGKLRPSCASLAYNKVLLYLVESDLPLFGCTQQPSASLISQPNTNHGQPCSSSETCQDWTSPGPIMAFKIPELQIFLAEFSETNISKRKLTFSLPNSLSLACLTAVLNLQALLPSQTEQSGKYFSGKYWKNFMATFLSIVFVIFRTCVPCHTFLWVAYQI
uniref:Uncharacterized protein n=1 Tax=Sphaerodactylus townsendi TaxID=933632 RepID=A0ACB8ENC8_9SAUR